MTRDGMRLVEALVGEGRVWAEAFGLPWGGRRREDARRPAAVMKAAAGVEGLPKQATRKSKAKARGRG
jgi:hypothetical protein